MGISTRTHKILWDWSGGKCAICKNDLIIDPTTLKDVESVVGDEAHMMERLYFLAKVERGLEQSEGETISHEEIKARFSTVIA